ncbi:MAG: IS5 family transposase [Methyloversatilis sp.]|uniref:IS5 family transposase n=1 Tax=Methyloversatilis sp. TaxID=2569862 RepID=UPI002736AD69|nr:IS5 family transposase [Methyloversatilis sp.]MDP3873240.1 IS5 family transposase [Methyloversatilis sp.]
MKRQTSFADLEYSARRKPTRKEKFLTDLDRLVPWSALIGLIEPHYYRGERGRPPVGLETMLRMYLCQNCLGLSDEGIEDAIVDSIAVRRFVGVDLIERQPPDATTLLKFRRLLECHDMPARIFALIREQLGQQGLILREGTIVDATLIAAPPSTKNKERERDADMHQTKKGNQWYFGMKAHIGVDAQTGLVHSMVTTAANESDVSQTHQLLHGEEKHVHADAGYQGANKREALKDCKAEFVVARRRSTYKKLDEADPVRKLIEQAEHAKASIRSKVEHVFHVVKNLFRHRKCRYKGLAKNTAQLQVLFAMANLVLSQRTLCAPYRTVAS